MLKSRRPVLLRNFRQILNKSKILNSKTNINYKNNTHNEIKLNKINAASQGYHAIIKMFKSKLLSTDTNKKLNHAYLRIIVM